MVGAAEMGRRGQELSSDSSIGALHSCTMGVLGVCCWGTAHSTRSTEAPGQLMGRDEDVRLEEGTPPWCRQRWGGGWMRLHSDGS